MLLLILFVLFFLLVGVLVTLGLFRVVSEKRLIIIGCILGAIILLPWEIPWARVGYYTVKCSHAPVVGSNFAASFDYYLPSSKSYVGAIGPFTNAYFCSQQQAEQASYHEYPLDATP